MPLHCGLINAVASTFPKAVVTAHWALFLAKFGQFLPGIVHPGAKVLQKLFQAHNLALLAIFTPQFAVAASLMNHGPVQAHTGSPFSSNIRPHRQQSPTINFLYFMAISK